MADVLERRSSRLPTTRIELAGVKNTAELEQFRIKFLGSNGRIKGLMKLLGGVPKEQKPAVGQRVNAVER